MIRSFFVFLFWILIASFIILYPMLISMYVYLPLFIGFAGYLIIWGFEGHGMRYIWLPLIYIINLDANLSLPMFLSILSILLFYLVLYEKIRFLKRCPMCVGVLSVAFIDLFYVGMLVGYDFIFDTTSIMIDSLLVYSLVFDLVFVVLI